jgi:hypothetical protein
MLWGIDRQWIERCTSPLPPPCTLIDVSAADAWFDQCLNPSRTVVLTKKYVLLLNPEENTRNLPNYEPGRVMDIIALTDIDIIEQEEGGESPNFTQHSFQT